MIKYTFVTLYVGAWLQVGITLPKYLMFPIRNKVRIEFYCERLEAEYVNIVNTVPFDGRLLSHIYIYIYGLNALITIN